MESPFRFLSTGIFGITSGGGPLISIGIFRPKLAVPCLTNRFFALIREFRKGIISGRSPVSDKSHSYWLARFNRKMPFHFPRLFPLISDRSIWHNGNAHGSVVRLQTGANHSCRFSNRNDWNRHEMIFRPASCNLY